LRCDVERARHSAHAPIQESRERGEQRQGRGDDRSDEPPRRRRSEHRGQARHVLSIPIDVDGSAVQRRRRDLGIPAERQHEEQRRKRDRDTARHQRRAGGASCQPLRDLRPGDQRQQHDGQLDRQLVPRRDEWRGPDVLECHGCVQHEQRRAEQQPLHDCRPPCGAHG